MKVLVIGYGSMGQKHVASLKINKFKEIYVLTQQKNIAYPTIKKMSQIHFSIMWSVLYPLFMNLWNVIYIQTFSIFIKY